jgi:predicted nuclease of predicted toxin-antitoxin system
MAEIPRLFISLYTDEDVTNELAPALRDRGYESQSAAEAGLLNKDDAVHLAYASEHGMTLLSCNADHFTALAKQYAASGRSHAGIVLSSEQYSRRRFGELLRLVLRLMDSMTADEMRDCVIYLQQLR